MAFHSAKESLSREEVIDILRRNVTLYKNEPEFVNYIVDLALYLLETLDEEGEGQREAGPAAGGASAPGSAPRPGLHSVRAIRVERSGLQTPEVQPARSSKPPPPRIGPPPEPTSHPENRFPRVQVDKGGKTRVYKVFRAGTNTIESLHCPICGSETRGERICPNCGNVL